MDACKSIEWDPRYPKGYYRRAVANFALGKYKAALEDFTRVLQLVPNDTDALAKKKVDGTLHYYSYSHSVIFGIYINIGM